MDVKELLTMDSNKVRHTPSLMSFYIETFVSVFGRTPNCAGCTFAHDFRELKSKLSLSIDNKIVYSPNINNKNMKKTFKLKVVSNKILKFVKNGAFQRSYDNKITEDFAVAYLTHGNQDELEQRRKEFSILPEAVRSSVDLAKAIEGMEGSEYIDNIEVVEDKTPEQEAEEAKTLILEVPASTVPETIQPEVKEESATGVLDASEELNADVVEETLEFEEAPAEEIKTAPEPKPAPAKKAAPKKTTAKPQTAKK